MMKKLGIMLLFMIALASAYGVGDTVIKTTKAWSITKQEYLTELVDFTIEDNTVCWKADDLLKFGSAVAVSAEITTMPKDSDISSDLFAISSMPVRDRDGTQIRTIDITRDDCIDLSPYEGRYEIGFGTTEFVYGDLKFNTTLLYNTEYCAPDSCMQVYEICGNDTITEEALSFFFIGYNSEINISKNIHFREWETVGYDYTETVCGTCIENLTSYDCDCVSEDRTGTREQYVNYPVSDFTGCQEIVWKGNNLPMGLYDNQPCIHDTCVKEFATVYVSLPYFIDNQSSTGRLYVGSLNLTADTNYTFTVCGDGTTEKEDGNQTFHWFDDFDDKTLWSGDTGFMNVSASGMNITAGGSATIYSTQTFDGNFSWLTSMYSIEIAGDTSVAGFAKSDFSHRAYKEMVDEGVNNYVTTRNGAAVTQTNTDWGTANSYFIDEIHSARNIRVRAYENAVERANSPISATLPNDALSAFVYVAGGATEYFEWMGVNRWVETPSVYYGANDSGAIINGETYAWCRIVNVTTPMDISGWAVPLNFTEFNDTRLVVINGTINETLPTVAFLSQEPADITSINIMTSIVNITYQVNDSNSTPFLFYNVNSSQRNEIIFVNGTGIDSTVYQNTTCQAVTPLSDTSMNWSCYLGDNDVYPGTYMLEEQVTDDTAHINWTLSNANHYVRMKILNVSNSTRFGLYEAMAFGGTQVSGVFYCNSSYVTGDPETSTFCTEFGNFDQNTAFNHTHSNNSKHLVFSFGINTTEGTIGGVEVTADSYFMLQGGSGGVEVSYVPNTSRSDTTATTTNSGGTWTAQTWTVDSHLHQFDPDDSLNYFLSVSPTFQNWSAENATNSSIRSDLLDLGGLPPTSPDVFAPVAGTYFGNMWVNYTQSISPNGYDISHYNITLVDPANIASVLFIVQSNNSVNLSYLFNTSLAPDGDYIVRVEAVDNISQFSYGYSDEITIFNSPPDVWLQAPADNNVYSSVTRDYSWICNNSISAAITARLYINSTLIDTVACTDDVLCSSSQTSLMNCSNYNWSVQCEDNLGRINESTNRTFNFSMVLTYVTPTPADGETVVNDESVGIRYQGYCIPLAANTTFSGTNWTTACSNNICWYTNTSRGSGTFNYQGWFQDYDGIWYPAGIRSLISVESPWADANVSFRFTGNYSLDGFTNYFYVFFYEDYGWYILAILSFGFSFVITRTYSQTMTAGGVGLLLIFFLSITFGNPMYIFMAGSILSLAIGYFWKSATG